MKRPIPATNEIKAFMHCAGCAPDRPETLSPREWVSVEVGWTELGLQIWCKRCEANVLHLDFQGRKYPDSTNRIAKGGR